MAEKTLKKQVEFDDFVLYYFQTTLTYMFLLSLYLNQGKGKEKSRGTWSKTQAEKGEGGIETERTRGERKNKEGKRRIEETRARREEKAWRTKAEGQGRKREETPRRNRVRSSILWIFFTVLFTITLTLCWWFLIISLPYELCMTDRCLKPVYLDRFG